MRALDSRNRVEKGGERSGGIMEVQRGSIGTRCRNRRERSLAEPRIGKVSYTSIDDVDSAREAHHEYGGIVTYGEDIELLAGDLANQQEPNGSPKG